MPGTAEEVRLLPGGPRDEVLREDLAELLPGGDALRLCSAQVPETLVFQAAVHVDQPLIVQPAAGVEVPRAKHVLPVPHHLRDV